MPSVPSRNKTLVIAVKHYGETDIVFWSFPILLDFFLWPVIFFGIVYLFTFDSSFYQIIFHLSIPLGRGTLKKLVKLVQIIKNRTLVNCSGQ